MRRTATLFAILAVSAGCTSFQDPSEDEYPRPRMTGQMNPPSTQPPWNQRGADASGNNSVAANNRMSSSSYNMTMPPNRMQLSPAYNSSGGSRVLPSSAYGVTNAGLKPIGTPSSGSQVVQAKAAQTTEEEEDKAIASMSAVSKGDDESDSHPKLPSINSHCPDGQCSGGHCAAKRCSAGADLLQEAGEEATTVLSSLAAKVTRPGAPPLHMVNSKRIHFNFKIDNVDPDKVTGVELWCTRNMKDWKCYDTDPGMRGKLTVEVREEGLYGFTLLARTGSSPSKDAPKTGDMPQVWVAIDMTRPAVKMGSISLAAGSHGRRLKIHWTATDKHLGPRPIKLCYATQPTGPWNIIANHLENNGHYEWQMADSTPRRFYLRVEATDLMGNVGVVEMPRAVRIEAPELPAIVTTSAREVSTEPATPGLLILPPPTSHQSAAADAPRPRVTILSIEADHSK